MKNVIWAMFLGFLMAPAAFSQDKPWSAEIFYPVSVGDSFGSSNQGIIGAGLDYRFAVLGKARLGASMGASWFATTLIEDTDPIRETEYRDFFLQAKVFYEAPLTSSEKLRFRAGLGWAFQHAEGPAFFDQDGRVQGTDLNTGPAIGIGLSYDLAPRWYMRAGTDFMFLSGESPNRTIGLTTIGVGFRF